jgi:hypothetical protein
MRRGNKNEIYCENGVFIGINLGADYCSEHEWGIEKLKKTFGIPYPKAEYHKFIDPNTEPIKAFGISRRTATIFPENNIIFIRAKDKTLLVVSNWMYNRAEIVKKLVEGWPGSVPKNYQELNLYNEKLATAWSESDFGIFADGRENYKHLDELYKAMERKDLAIFIGGKDSVFSNPGLLLCIASRLPDEVLSDMKYNDEDQYNLRVAAWNTGIYQKLEKIEKAEQEITCRSFILDSLVGYFALSPRWTKLNEQEKTKHPVIFWLNPKRQETNNSGWFTVEELEQWIEGKGPIPKKL